MVLISILITVLYVTLIGSFVYGFDKVKSFKLKDLKSKTRFSVVIPLRNEAENLPDLLKSISSLHYPKHLFEIVFVDDDSEDSSQELINTFKNINESFQITVLNNNRLTNSPKKDAISAAIQHSKNEWIITTDADCVLPKYWLDSFDEFIQQTQVRCIAAPVTYHIKNNFLCRFQLLDLLSLQGATIGGFGIQKPFLCNGANFGYEKNVFMEVNGFEGNTNIASGDDIFLLEKVIKMFPNHIYYLKCESAIVLTKSQTSWEQLMAQRIRWAAKTSAYNNWFGKLTGLIVLLMNTLAITGLLLSILGILNFKILLYILFIKFNIDVLLIYKSASFYNQKDILRSVLFGFILYLFFSVYVAFLSLFKGYKWKDRSYKK